jgi:hypothetical protein
MELADLSTPRGRRIERLNAAWYGEAYPVDDTQWAVSRGHRGRG